MDSFECARSDFAAIPVEHEALKLGRDDNRHPDAGRTDVKVEIFM